MRKLLAIASVLLMTPSLAHAEVFWTEGFDYDDGDLEVVSGGLWPTHSPDEGGTGPIQVVSNEAVVTSPGSFDHNRQVGAVLGVEDTWYYSTVFSVELGEGQTINDDYFIHFKDDTTFNFNARLALDDPADMETGDFSLSIWASSEGDGQADWDGDFSFGETITAVVGFNNATGEATLWVNPTDINSTSIVDDELDDAMRGLNAVALRQDGSSSSVVTVDVIAVGTTFDEVLAAVSDGGGFAVEDLNTDGFVDGLDLGILLGNFDQSGIAPSGGELNGSDPVDGLDLGILLGAWNPPAGISSVPEPASAALLGLALVLLPRGRQQSRA